MGLVYTFISEGECGYVTEGVRPASGTGVLLSAEERREVLGWIGGGGTALPRRSNKGDKQTVTVRKEPPRNEADRARYPREGARDLGSRDGNGDIGFDGVGGRRYPVRHPGA